MDLENPYNNYNNDNNNLLEGQQSTLSKSLGNSRRNFIKKVYGILCSQLILTIIMCVISMNSPAFSNFQRVNYGIMIFCAVAVIILLIALLCYTKVARKVPANYIILFVFTFCESYMVSYACSSVGEPKIVIIAAGMTLGVTVSLTIYAFTTKTDFTICGSTLFIVSSALLMFGLFMWIFNSWNKPLYILYCALIVILYGFYLVFDTQLVMGGKTYELTIDDYIIGAVILYVDIIVLFLRLLELLSILIR